MTTTLFFKALAVTVFRRLADGREIRLYDTQVMRCGDNNPHWQVFTCRKQMPESLSIFILPPSREELDRRLRGRGQDSEEIIARRMQDAVNEMSHYPEFDYLVINDDFEQALAELKAIVIGNRMRLERQEKRHEQLLSDLVT